MQEQSSGSVAHVQNSSPDLTPTCYTVVLSFTPLAELTYQELQGRRGHARALPTRHSVLVKACQGD